MQANFIFAETNTDKLYQLNSFLKRPPPMWIGNPSVPPSPSCTSRNRKTDAHLDEVLFDKFLEMLESKGIKPVRSLLERCEALVLRERSFDMLFFRGIRNLGSNINRYLTLRKLGRVI